MPPPFHRWTDAENFRHTLRTAFRWLISEVQYRVIRTLRRSVQFDNRGFQSLRRTSETMARISLCQLLKGFRIAFPDLVHGVAKFACPDSVLYGSQDKCLPVGHHFKSGVDGRTEQVQNGLLNHES